MKTRRMTKLQPNDGGDATTALHSQYQGPEDGVSCGGIEIDIPGDLDVSALEIRLPGHPFSCPTSETIISLYRVLLEQSLTIETLEKERDQARADALRLEVELDQVLQDQDVQISQMRASLEEAHREIEGAQTEKKQLAVTRSALEAQVASLTDTTSSSSSQTEALQRKVSQIEGEKLDLLTVVDGQRESLVQRDEENQSLRARQSELRAEISKLQIDLAEAKSSEGTGKFHSYTLEQEVNLLREENQRHVTELSALQESSAAERRSKHAEVVKLQTQVDSLTQENTSIGSRLSALQKAHRSQETQLMEALSKAQTLQAEVAQQTAQFRAESETQKRLVELMDRRNEESRRRVEEIEKEWDSVLAKASTNEDSLRNELVKERQRNEELEARLQELRVAAERIGPADGMSTPIGGRLISSTPGSSASPFLSLSPTASLATKLQKSGRSYTEVYADYVKMGEELTKQKEETRRLESALAQILSDIEERAPLIQSQRVEYGRVTEELSQLANQLAHTSAERDDLARSSAEDTVTAKKLREENDMLQKQLTDLGRQVQSLLREIAVREDPSLDNVDFNMPEGTLEDTDSDQVITNHLVLFKSLPQLQQQNQRLLRTARGLAAQWEERQADIETEWRKEETQALAEASEAVKEMEAELQRQKVLSMAHQRERDMYRSLLTRQGRDPSAQPATVPVSADRGAGDNYTDYRQLLEEQQNLFETFKTEIGSDSAKLKEDLARAQREVGQLSAQLAKANAQIDFLQERIKIAQNSAELQSQEISNLQKRNQQLQEAVGKTEIQSYHVSEELRDAKVVMERLRNESASLQAENNFLKAFEARLQEENKNLSKEKAQLKDLVGNIQAIQAELERSGESEKRRQETQIKHFETHAQDLRDELNKQSQESRRALLQKDLELKEFQVRMETLMSDLFRSREAQSVAETSQAHLQTRVDDLLRQLQGASSKLSIYERRPETEDVSGLNGHNVPEEQQLRAEVADLSAALKNAEIDLARAREHVEQFKNISQANEEALESLNATFEQYKLETGKQLVSINSELQHTKEQYDQVQQELTTALREQAELNQQLETQRVEFDNDRRTLEATIADLGTFEDRAYASQKSTQEDLRRQAQLAQDAHEKYSRELVAHAESVKQINAFKEELAEAQAKAREHQTQAETAIARTNASETTWASQKETLIKEMEEISARCKDLTSQNAALHQHLETVSSQAARIRQATEASTSNVLAAGTNGTDLDDAAAELRGVITFVRREKEIAELQLDLHKQENTRLKSYSDHLAQSLEIARNLLKEEREKASKSAASAEQYADLMEKINQLSLLRESNTTLRSEAEANSKAAHDLRIKLQKAQSELEPLKERVRVLDAELRAREDHIHRLEEDNKRLKDRTEQILSKHHRVDPAEVQSLRDEVAFLKTERDELKGQIETKDTQTERIKEALQTAKAAHSKLLNETRVRFTSFNDQIAQLTAQLESTKQLVASLEAEKTSLRAELAEQKTSGEATASAASELSATIARLQAERDSVLAEKKSTVEQSTPSAEINELKARFEKEMAEAKANEQLLNNRNDMMKRDNIKMKVEMKSLESQLADLRQAQEAGKGDGSIAEMAKAAPDVQELVGRRIAEVTASHEHDKEQAVATAVQNVAKDMVPRSELEAEVRNGAAQLKALEERITASHQAELQTARDTAALAAAQPPSGALADVEAKIAEARKEWEAETHASLRKEIESGLATQHLEAIEATKTSVTQELEAKQKVKDGQISRLRGVIDQLRKQLTDLTNPSPPNAAASEAPKPHPVKPVPGTPTAPNTLPAKPVPTTPANTPTAPAAIRGQAVARGRGAGRGAGIGRGSQVLQNVNATIAASTSPSTSQPPTSIIGAAQGAKRPRESEAPEASPGDVKRPRGVAPVINRNRLPAQPKPSTPQDQTPS